MEDGDAFGFLVLFIKNICKNKKRGVENVLMKYHSA